MHGYFAQPLSDGLQQGFAIDESERFEAKLLEAKNVLYLTDNCGEIALRCHSDRSYCRYGKNDRDFSKRDPDFE